MIRCLRNILRANKPKFNADDEVFIHHECDYCHATTHARCRGMITGRRAILHSLFPRKYIYNYSFFCHDCHEAWSNIGESMVEANYTELDEFKVRIEVLNGI